MSAWNCIAEEEIRSFLDGTIPLERREEIEVHFSNCADCRKQLLKAYTSAEKVEVSPASIRLKRKAKRLPNRLRTPAFLFLVRNPLVFAPALVAFIAIGIVIYYQQNWRSTESIEQTFRNEPSTGEIIRLREPGTAKVISEAKIHFLWSAITEARNYELRILSEDGDVVFEASPENNSYELDSSSVSLTPRRVYFWYITAHTRDGRRVESSPSKFFYHPR